MAKTIYRVLDPLPVWKIREYYVEVDEDEGEDIWEAISEYDGPMELAGEMRVEGLDSPPEYKKVEYIPEDFGEEAE